MDAVHMLAIDQHSGRAGSKGVTRVFIDLAKKGPSEILLKQDKNMFRFTPWGAGTGYLAKTGLGGSKETAENRQKRQGEEST